MKKIIALILSICMVCSMAACSSNNSEPIDSQTDNTSATTSSTTLATTIPNETKPENGVYGDKIILGNIEFTKPEGFSVTIIDENTMTLELEDSSCVIGLAAIDISELDEEKTKIYLPMQRESFLDADSTKLEEGQLEGYVAGFDVLVNSYAEVDGKNNTIACMDTTFTDSWFVYTIVAKCDLQSDYAETFGKMFAEFMGYSTYIGSEPRFDFIQ